jgi:hypothetical protein
LVSKILKGRPVSVGPAWALALRVKNKITAIKEKYFICSLLL